jgi:HAD superfamily hydrolase (TIGR01484 family)
MFMKNQKALLLFTDIDETLLPIDIKSLKKFINLIKKIQVKENIMIKLCPISGRQPLYVKGIMNFLNGLFENEGIKNFCEIGAGEQGSIIVKNTEPEQLIYLATREDAILKQNISHAFKQNALSKYFSQSPQNVIINTFSLKDEFKEKMTPKLKLYILSRLKKDLELQFKDKIAISNVVDCLEVAPQNMGKDIAIQNILEEYSKRFDILGITYSGDSENDLRAVQFLANLSKSTKMKVHVFLPSNAYPCLESSQIETFQKNLKKNCIKKSNYQLFNGVLDLLRKEFDKGSLLYPQNQEKESFKVPPIENSKTRNQFIFVT